MEHNQIIPTEPIPNDKLKRNRKLQIFVQYANFKDINDYKTGIFHTILIFLVILRNIN